MDNSLEWLNALAKEIEAHEEKGRECLKTNQAIQDILNIQFPSFDFNFDMQDVTHTTVWGQVGTGMSSLRSQECEVVENRRENK